MSNASENSFFSRSVGPVYWVRTPMSGGLPTTQLTLDERTGLLRDPAGKLVRTEFALTDGSAEVAGRLVDADERRGVYLYGLDGPLRQMAVVEGLHAVHSGRVDPRSTPRRPAGEPRWRWRERAGGEAP